MTRHSYILVFQEDYSGNADDPTDITRALDPNDRLFVFDRNIAFIETAQDIEALTKRLRARPFGTTYFFLADISNTSRAGNMVPTFWNMLRDKNNMMPVS